jgi:hypothetical protein
MHFLLLLALLLTLSLTRAKSSDFEEFVTVRFPTLLTLFIIDRAHRDQIYDRQN